MIRCLIGFGAICLLPSIAIAQASAPEIGTTMVVVNKAEVVSGDKTQKLKKGAKIRTQEKIVTGKKSSTEFLLLDKTNLAVGSNAELVLDEFVYDPNPSKRKVVLTNLKGALRFVTGKNPSKTYTIKTPTATIGIRGTMIDIYVDDKGKTVVGLLKGKVRVCPPGSRKCRRLRRPGRFLAITKRGKITITTRPGRLFGGDVPFALAFPFISGRLSLRGPLATPGRLRLNIMRRVGLPIRKIIPGLNKFNGGIPGVGEILNPRKAKGKKLRKRKKKRRGRKKRRGGFKLKSPF